MRCANVCSVRPEIFCAENIHSILPVVPFPEKQKIKQKALNSKKTPSKEKRTWLKKLNPYFLSL